MQIREMQISRRSVKSRLRNPKLCIKQTNKQRQKATDGGRRHSEFLSEVGYSAMVTLVSPMSVCTPDLTQISSLMTEMWPKFQI